MTSVPLPTTLIPLLEPYMPSSELDGGSVCAIVSGILVIVGFSTAAMLYLRAHKQSEMIKQQLRQKRAASPTIPVGNRQGSAFATAGDIDAERAVATGAVNRSSPYTASPQPPYQQRPPQQLAPHEDFFGAYVVRTPLSRDAMKRQMEEDDEL